MHVVATAGHVDHGKSTLVRALTGTDPDRWVEEKERGLTIDLGFAGTTLPSGREVAFVDVPGHIRFLKNMLAGVGAVDACLFVVDAVEGWKPQSEEHLRILELLGIDHGLVALTKIGLVDPELGELAGLDVADHVAGTFLAGAEVIPVDAVDGTGLHDLRAGLDRLLAATPTSEDRDRPRLWVDRSFAPAGAGTVVTGTLAGGSVSVGDELSVEPDGRTVRVRGLQVLGRDHERLEPGNRAALNLVGVSHDQVLRGHALVRPGQWHRVKVVDASILVLDALDHSVSRRGNFKAYLGSGEHHVQLRVLGSDGVEPGHQGLVRLYLPRPLPLLPGDRFVLRETGRSETVGGGEVLDVAPVLAAAVACPDRSIDRVVAERGWVEAAALERLTAHRRPPDVGRWVVSAVARAETERQVGDAIAAAGPLGLDVATLDERQRAVLVTLDGIEVDDGRARPVEQADPLAGHPYVAALDAASFRPPPPDGVDRAELAALVRRGLVVERDGAYFSPRAVEEAGRIVAALLGRQPEGLAVSEIRDALGTTRKWAMPLLAHLDATGVTRRRGDLRVAGPRLPSG